MTVISNAARPLRVGVLFIGLLAPLGGCGGDGDPGSRGDTPRASPADRPDTAATGARSNADTATDPASLIQRIYDYGLSFGQSLEAIRESLGSPASADTTVAPNRHVRDATDSLFVLEYPGLRFELNRPGPVEGDLLTSASLSSADRALPGGFRIGATAGEDLRRALGRPASTRLRADTTVLSYQTPGMAADRSVEFFVADDTLRRVTWLPYVD